MRIGSAMARLRIIAFYVLLPGCLLGIWWMLAEFNLVKPLFLPHPVKVLRTAADLWINGKLSEHAIASVKRILWGFLITFSLAFPVGAVMGLSATGRRIFEPLNSLFRYMPFPAFVPLLILWFGIGNTTHIAVIIVGTLFQLIVMFRDAFKDIHKEYLETAKSLSFSKPRMFLLVQLPAALPQCYDAVRLGLGWAWTCLIVAELVGADNGLGYLIIVGQRYLKTPQVFVGIIVIGMLGLLTDTILRTLRRFIVPWASEIR